MPALGSRVLAEITGVGVAAFGAALWLAGSFTDVGRAADTAQGTQETSASSIARGREIFNREWMPGDSRSHGGDGLGPVYNDTSCVACHNSGGSGGAGPVSKNIDILSASRNLRQVLLDPSGNTAPSPPPTQFSTALTDFHAGFKTGRTVVLHKFGIDPNYQEWRQRATQGQVASQNLQVEFIPQAFTQVASFNGGIQVASNDTRVNLPGASLQNLSRNSAISRTPGGGSIQLGEFVVSRSQRNPTPLFGLGLIDAIPDRVIEEAAAKRYAEFPEIQGRVSRLKDGRIGRLGWKGQTASTGDFVISACAVELGLEVPGQHQGTVPQAPKYQSDGMDLSAEECNDLTAYVASLPRPVEREAATPAEAANLAAGKAHFTKVGCATCHTETLGEVQGLYSDLLLHDMGQDTGDDGSYNGDPDDPDSEEPLNPKLNAPAILANGQPAPAAASPKGATRTEWRTTPLWGVRDSGPYLHDGRAQTIDEAVAMHGGQAAGVSQRYFALSTRERLQLEGFLKSLVAPEQSVAYGNR